MTEPGTDAPQPDAVPLADVLALLSHGHIEAQGLVPWSSNYTFLVAVIRGDLQALAVYKPARGEQPLWDFDAGTLCRREVAAYVLSTVLGWPDVPPTVLRDGPHGVGSLQLYIDADPDEHYFVLRGRREFEAAFRRIALFDALVNNADRKGGHVLRSAEGRIWAIDHGLTFHVEPKLRTVIWDYAGQPLEEEVIADLNSLHASLGDAQSGLVAALSRLLERAEVDALRRRAARLLEEGVYPRARPGRRHVPYPLV